MAPATFALSRAVSYTHLDVYKRQIQVDFDYTNLVNEIPQNIYAIYGDRGMPEYPNKIQDLNLSPQTLRNLNLVFSCNSCHMIMVENPKQLSEVIKKILEAK